MYHFKILNFLEFGARNISDLVTFGNKIIFFNNKKQFAD